MISSPRRLVVLALVGLVAATPGCGSGRIRRVLVEPGQAASLDRSSPYLKAHMRDGGVYVLSRWSVDEAGRKVSGEGERLGPAREPLARGAFTLDLDAVALFETNVTRQSPAVAALAIVTGISAAITIACAASPKTCFGSCPTFYVSDGARPVLQAEGFSASVAPSLEAADVDALFRARPTGRELEVRMTNEALETHVVRHVDLLAAPRSPGTRVMATAAGRFFETERAQAPSLCRAAEGDCVEALRAFDGQERASAADSRDLAARELVELEFSRDAPGPYGLAVASRQTLLSTFLFYQSLGYMGRSAPALLARLERGEGGLRKRAGALDRLLGGVEVLVERPGGGWRPAGELRETGPLATDVKLVPLPPAGPGRLRLRLRLARGHWRLDQVALVSIGRPVEPLRLRPESRLHAAVAPARQGGAAEASEAAPLTTLPGDEYVFRYRLPGEPDGYELFLESRGYYLEWMRDEWLAEEDPERVALLFRDPRRALRVLAPQFKQQEARMEQIFWSSRFARP